ncbi:MAG TPA: NAD(P)H-binding protein [Methylovirgula sp.]|nr:NAD(P)H-binding protein [Methylovirgula sp.]
MLLVTGASGTVGSAVLAEVIRAGVPHRALFRSEQDAAKAPAGTEVAIADFADPLSLKRAFAGIDSLFLVCSPIPQLVELESNVIEAAGDRRRIVLNSALGAGDYPKSFPSWHRRVEDRLRAAGNPYCILRPNSFMQNVLAFYAPSIRAEGAFYSALGEAKICYVDVRDIAAVAVQALRGLHDGETYELHGPEGLSCAEVAAKIEKNAGIPARYVDIPEEAQRQAMLAQGMPEWQVTALLELQEYYTGGKGGEPDGTLERLLGRAPRALDALLQEHAAEFRRAKG